MPVIRAPIAPRTAIAATILPSTNGTTLPSPNGTMIPTKEGPAVAVATELLHQPCPGPGHLLEEFMTTILIVVVLLMLLGGEGFYGYRRRW